MAVGWVASATVCVVMLLAPSSVPAVHYSQSLFTDEIASAPNRFSGATFIPDIAPVITVVHGQSSTTLSWAPVTFTGGGVVTYLVRRISPNGTSVIVCSGAEAPIVESSGLLHCVDGASGGRKNLSYSQQPIVMRDGIATWSLEPSVLARGA